ncbi:hypothetical protein RVV18_001995 [Burkholderia ambifaria]|uniref:Uncharacterized protein n=1 Tax=Burkholderia ambifaria (strain ATCC BAA-244 / DSM 16087 / CCUG 44356 / LMG 19182 / AMMD) TaxID=339670 RepID=Q0BGF6_BURCM|nr:hypothetical protein [Burkholderia ambifaria]ABI86767.1 hypothetical protein Bamb_1209 [Burkholderia ambifaria AMMD]AJY23433.1 hypothetical protein CH72_327 [Burkholderia ambifaria AMMD]ELK6206572.1 hypothetical protein [Burkholderia ambifaria]MBR7929611.1 hypothetical protein [Burkholderia ambifaria]MBR8347305.1 hypothetical protein [Burkholderia ambifaria]
MTIKTRIERLEEALAAQSVETNVTYCVLIYDPSNPPDFDAVARERDLTHVVWLPDNGRRDREKRGVLCGENTQTLPGERGDD